MLILALDPGSTKCGVALSDGDGQLLDQTCCHTGVLCEAVTQLLAGRTPDVVVLGSGTASSVVEGTIRQLLPVARISIVDERNSTLEAREIWLEESHCHGLWRYLPRMVRLLLSPSALDGYAALALARRWLKDGRDRQNG